MSLYDSPNDGPEPHVPKAPQACMSCRKQKRKCNKALPACALCHRMNRHCDYSDATPLPSSDDFDVLRMRVLELESRLNRENNISNLPTPFATPSSTTVSVSDVLAPPVPVYTPPQEGPWQGIQNRFPAIAFLDVDSFKYGGIAVPKPSVEIPSEVLELLGDGPSVQAIITEYFATVHHWMPIVSRKKLTRNMANPLWDAGPDLALLFLCMKLITSKPQDGIESSQNPAYISAKRFVAVMEATGMVSMLILQANLLVTWFEYGQAIYPAAWMSAGWCVRYGNLLGINGFNVAGPMLGRPNTWTEQEEWRRAWWAVLIVDRVISIGSQRHILTTQEPHDDDPLPVEDAAWEDGEMAHALQRAVSSPMDNVVTPFLRLCQASVMMGKVLKHHHGEKFSSETTRFSSASQLYLEISVLARKITEEAANSPHYLTFAAPMALIFSALLTLCDPYSCPQGGNSAATPEASAMQVQAIDGLKTVSRSIVEFADQINTATSMPRDLDQISPAIMDALYGAASSYAWIVRESGDESSQMALDSIRHFLRRLGTRWRNAAEYLRILEAQEFTYAIGSASS